MKGYRVTPVVWGELNKKFGARQRVVMVSHGMREATDNGSQVRKRR